MVPTKSVENFNFLLVGCYDLSVIMVLGFRRTYKKTILSLNKDHVFLSDEVVLRSEIGNKINDWSEITIFSWTYDCQLLVASGLQN